ncbi:MAG TPA: TolC family protein [Puia sp.]|nr:TolC family protein [Puia sp.]
MYLRLSVFIVILMALAGIARGQDSTAAHGQDTSARLPAHWDLQTCLDYAKKNNVQLNMLRLNVQTAQQNYLQSRASRQPTLTGTVPLTYTHSNKSVSGVIGGFQTQSSFSQSFTLSSGMTIYNGGTINNDIRQKNLEIESANLSVLQTINDITLQITQAYLAILLARENVVYIEDLVHTSAAQVDQGKKEYEAGSIARNAYIELQAQLATDKYNLVTAQSAVRQNKVTLKQLLQLPFQDSFDIVSPDTIISKEAVTGLDSAVAIAIRTRPEIKNARLGIDISRYDLAKAKAGYLPILSASAELSTGYSNNVSDDYTRQLDNNFFQQVGLNLSIPIFTRRTVKTQVEEAKIEVANSKLSLLGTQTTLALDIEQAYINVVNAQAQYDAAVEELRANQETFRIAAEELKVGASDIVDYLQQKTLYTQAFQAYIQAKYNAALSIRIYDFYMGIAVKL